MVGIWHRTIQSFVEKKFNNDVTEISCGVSDGFSNSRIIDILINRIAYELQSSRITLQEVNQRNSDHIKSLKIDKTIWIVDFSDHMDNITEEQNGDYKITFPSSCSWKFDSFINCEYYFIGDYECIYLINPKNVKNYCTTVNYRLSYDEFFTDNLLNNQFNNLSLNEGGNEIPRQYSIFYNQRCAGSGKTFESIQLLLNEEIQLNQVTTFIYLTKMHSAKNIIKEEFENQLKNTLLNSKKLKNIKSEFKLIENFDEKNNRHYFLRFEKKYNNKIINCEIIIGTFDSFTYALIDNEKFKAKYDNFKDREDHIIKNGPFLSERKTFKYGGKTFKLNNECLIIIDEAQDLSENKMIMLEKICENYYVNLYVIGDYMQSIILEENALKYLKFSNNPNILKLNKENCVKRFHKKCSMDFINHFNDSNFKKYNLENISKICDGKKDCEKYKYNCVHYNDEQSIEILPQVYDYELLYEIEKNNPYHEINYIKSILNDEVNKYGYLPEDVTFISPAINNVPFIELLLEEIELFWRQKLNDFDSNKRFCYLHDSNEGITINLNDSKNSTRFISIHTSKGTGTPLVFLLGFSDGVLEIFDRDKKLKYNSLIYVALTRHKNKLYIGCSRDELFDRIYNSYKFVYSKITLIENKKPKKINFSSNFDFQKILKFMKNEKNLKKIIDTYDEDLKNKLCEIFSTSNSKIRSSIVDINHHILRYYGIYFQLRSFTSFFHENQNKNKSAKSYIPPIHKMKNYEIINFDKITCNKKKIKKNEVFNSSKHISFEKYGKNYNIICCKYHCLHKDIYNKIKRDFNCKMINDSNINIYKSELSFFESPCCLNHLEELKSCIPVNKKLGIDIKIFTAIIKEIQEKIQKKILGKFCPVEILFLSYIEQINIRGNFSNISIKDIHEFMIYIKEKKDFLGHKNFKCKCIKIFNLNEEFNDEQRKENLYFYSYISKMDKILNQCFKPEIKNFIKNKNYDNIQFSHNTSIWSKIFNDFTIISNSMTCMSNDDYYFDFIVQPEISSININEILIKIMLKKYLFNKKIINENYDTVINGMINNKKYAICLLTLSYDKPIFLNFDHVFDQQEIFDELFKDFILLKFTKFHEDVYENLIYSKFNKKDFEEDFKTCFINEEYLQYLYYCKSIVKTKSAFISRANEYIIKKYELKNEISLADKEFNDLNNFEINQDKSNLNFNNFFEKNESFLDYSCDNLYDEKILNEIENGRCLVDEFDRAFIYNSDSSDNFEINQNEFDPNYVEFYKNNDSYEIYFNDKYYKINKFFDLNEKSTIKNNFYFLIKNNFIDIKKNYTKKKIKKIFFNGFNKIFIKNLNLYTEKIKKLIKNNSIIDTNKTTKISEIIDKNFIINDRFLVTIKDEYEDWAIDLYQNEDLSIPDSPFRYFINDNDILEEIIYIYEMDKKNYFLIKEEIPIFIAWDKNKNFIYLNEEKNIIGDEINIDFIKIEKISDFTLNFNDFNNFHNFHDFHDFHDFHKIEKSKYNIYREKIIKNNNLKKCLNFNNIHIKNKIDQIFKLADYNFI